MQGDRGGPCPGGIPPTAQDFAGSYPATFSQPQIPKNKIRPKSQMPYDESAKARRGYDLAVACMREVAIRRGEIEPRPR